MPGLWDMHTHYQATGAESLDLFVAKGIVGTRDMGGDADELTFAGHVPMNVTMEDAANADMRSI